jgi:cation diffusion facilitator CzcD-associated flavoprotein CzcO
VRTQVAIVGSGFGGLGAAIRLRAAGFTDLVLLERARDLGGTWRDNTYPGCACDVESHLYSFSFAPNPDWTDRFSGWEEIHRYLKGCAERYGIAPLVRFEHEVTSARWDEGGRCWRIETTRGPREAAVLVLASGPLSDPVMPRVPGLERFEGRVFHSARWDHGYDLAGKQVAVIGTGASAIQFVPRIQPLVRRLWLFQRTPPWVMPRLDGPIRPWQRRLYRRLPLLQKAFRFGIYAGREASVLLFRHPAAMRRMQRLARWNLERAVSDPALRARLLPSYTMGCKRVLLSSDYYPAVAQPNVELVTASLTEVRARAVVDEAGVARETDAIIFATGFSPTEPPLAPCIAGRGGRTLAEAWAGRPRAHLGTTVAGFPNLFLLLGPNTGVGHTSVVYMMEAQMDHLVEAMRFMRARGVDAVEPRPEAQEAYVAEVERRTRGTVWTAGGCRSWYLDRTGHSSAIWPDFTWRYARRLARFRAEEYVA